MSNVQTSPFNPVSQSVSFTQFKSKNYESHQIVFHVLARPAHFGQNHGSGSRSNEVTPTQQACQAAVQFGVSQHARPLCGWSYCPIWRQLKHRSSYPSGPILIAGRAVVALFVGLHAWDFRFHLPRYHLPTFPVACVVGPVARVQTGPFDRVRNAVCSCHVRTADWAFLLYPT